MQAPSRYRFAGGIGRPIAMSPQPASAWYTLSQLSSSAEGPSFPKDSVNYSAPKLIGAVLVAFSIAVKRQTENGTSLLERDSIMRSSDVYRVPAERYESLLRTVESFAALDQDESLYIDGDSLKGGQRFIDILRACNVPLPMVFAHGGDALVFTWDMLHTRRYVTTSNNLAELQEFQKIGADIECLSAFDLNKPDEVGNLMSYIGGKQWL
jgi:hypothetical protein